jgi:PEP-CTERM motif
MKNQIRNMISALAIALASFSAQAGVVYDGGNPNQVIGFFGESDFNYTIAATQAKLSTAVTSNSMTWWGSAFDYGGANINNPAQDNFTLTIYAGGNPTPGSLLDTINLGTGNGVATGNLIFGTAPEYVYNASYSNLTLGAGNYFFGLSNSNNYFTNNGSDCSSYGLCNNIWIWETTSGGSQLAGASYSASPPGWQVNSGGSYTENLAFKLNYNQNQSPVPEPLTYAMLLAGLGLIGFTTLRRKDFSA